MESWLRRARTADIEAILTQRRLADRAVKGALMKLLYARLQTLAKSALSSAAALAGCQSSAAEPIFTPIQTDVFHHSGGQAVAWADYDQDGDLDLVVGFKDGPVRLYRQENGAFIKNAKTPEIGDLDSDFRSLSWGDFNQDGRPDLYIGFGRDSGQRNRLLVGRDNVFEEQAALWGVDAAGTSRQSSWIDYDLDGDSDLFVAMRDRASKLFRNDGDRFTDVSSATGLNDPRRSVGAVWFDYDQDGDLDLYLPNQSGDRDGLYRNNSGHFTDVAQTLGMDRPQRPLREGSVGATLCDINNDGHFDIFVPVYGVDMLYVSDGLGGYSDQAEAWGVDDDAQAVSADCGDFNNDGLMDLYLVAYRPGEAHGHDRLYQNRGGYFEDVFPAALNRFDADHGVRFADFDNDGDLDLALTNRHPDARHSVWRNDLAPSSERNYLKVTVLNKEGHYTRQGDEIRVLATGSETIIAASVVDTGGGYVSQNLMPAHFGLGAADTVTVEVHSMSPEGRLVTRLKDVPANQAISIRVDIE